MANAEPDTKVLFLHVLKLLVNKVRWKSLAVIELIECKLCDRNNPSVLDGFICEEIWCPQVLYERHFQVYCNRNRQNSLQIECQIVSYVIVKSVVPRGDADSKLERIANHQCQI